MPAASVNRLLLTSPLARSQGQGPLFPHPEVLLSSHHPGPSTQSPVLASRRSPANLLPTTAQRSHPPATLETACEPSSVWRSASRLNCPDAAIGRRCATGKRCCSTPCGHSHEDDGILTDAPALRALATTVRFASTARH